MKTQPKIKLSSLHLNDGSHGLPKNPRFIRDERFKKLCDSIRDFPDAMKARGIVVDERGVILGGNMRWRACSELGMKEIPAAWVHRLTGLTVEQKRRFVIMDNRGFGEDDMDLLANEWDIDELIDAGFDEEELTGLVDKDEEQDAEPQMDKAEELNKVWKAKTGDLWQIGEHRLACGNSTKADDVARVMGGEKAQLVFTDPPYGVDYEGGTTVREKLAGDDTTALYDPCCRVARDNSDDKATLYLWHAGVKGIAAAAAAAAAGYQIRCEIIWNKNMAQFGALSAQYKQKHEPCYYCFKKGKTARWFGPTNEVTVWDADRASVNEFHPTQKPVEIAVRAMRNSSEGGDVIWDGFLGSGTTMVACQNLNRKCRGIEISPAYCAVILQRMTDAFPGIKIKRVK